MLLLSSLYFNKRELRAQVGVLESSGDFGLEPPHLYPFVTVGQVLEMSQSFVVVTPSPARVLHFVAFMQRRREQDDTRQQATFLSN